MEKAAALMAGRRRRSGWQARRGWQPRPAPSRQRTARYSRIVGLLRVVLPALALGLLALLALWPNIAGDVAPVADPGESDSAPAVERPHMLNPRYFGTDGRNRPFQIRAERATYLDEAAGVVALDSPSALMELADGGEVRLRAQTGYFNRNTQVVELQGDVRLRDHRGHVVETSRAIILLESGRAHGDQPVVGRGPFGDVTGSGFEWRNEDGVLRLRGPARLILDPAQGDER